MLAMNTRIAFIAATLLGCGLSLASESELLRVWSGHGASVKERAEAVNRAFTNGTPVTVIVSALGTNYTRCFNSARIWIGPEPEPPNTMWLSYRFGEDAVTIGTSAVFGVDLDPVSGKFTGAGYSLPVKHSADTTNQIRIGQQAGGANGSQPFSSVTNTTTSAAGSRRSP